MLRSWLNIQIGVPKIRQKGIKFKFPSIPFQPKINSRPTALVFQFPNITPQMRSGSKLTNSHIIITISKQNMYTLPTLKPVHPQSSYIFTHFVRNKV